MANESFRRTAAEKRESGQFRSEPPPEIPERLARAFPEMRGWGDSLTQFHGRQEERIRLALAELQLGEEDFVKTFEDNL